MRARMDWTTAVVGEPKVRRVDVLVVGARADAAQRGKAR